MKFNGLNTNEPKSSFYTPMPIEEENRREPADSFENESKEITEEEKLANEVIKKSSSYGITIEENDIINYLRKGFIEKRLEILPNRLYATLKTLTVKEISAINTEISDILADNRDLIDTEVRLRNTRVSSYYYLIELGDSLTNLRKLHSNNDNAKNSFFAQIDTLPPIVLSEIAERQRTLEAAIQAHIMHPNIGKK